MSFPRLAVTFALLVALIATQVDAVQPNVTTELAVKGPLILEDNGFQHRERGKAFPLSEHTAVRLGAGKWERTGKDNNIWRSTHSPSAGHVPVMAYQGFDEKNLIIEVTFRFGRNTEPWHHQCFRIAADRRPDITGHIISAWANVNNDFIESGFLLQHIRKTPEKQILQDLLLDYQNLKITPGKWHTAILEIVNDEALFRLGKHVAYTKAEQITTSKTLVSLTMGSTWHEVKHVRIWRANLNPQWESTKNSLLSKRRTFEVMKHHYKNP
ncbi:MAG: hypothetical protein VX876_05830 [Planctomycetota bacterium]|nr:hypothetical protein [Planctomycetota bacterium]